MTRYLVRRLFLAIPVLLGVSILVFVMMRLIPGDIVDRILAGNVGGVTLEQREEMRRLFGLDQPLHVQYFEWIRHVARGDLGHSLLNGRPVLTDLMLRIPVSLELATLSLILTLAIGVPLGVVSATQRYKWPDYLASFLALGGVSIPNFWLGTMLVLVFSIGLRWLPSAGYVAFTENPLENLRLMALPIISLSLAEAAVIMRMVRSTTLEVLRQDYVRTAEAKGLSGFKVLTNHVLSNTLIPVLTVVGLSIGYLLSGTIIIEELFSIPGIGRFALMGIINRDYPVVQGTVLVIAIIYVFVNLAVDILYGVVDPRVRHE